MPNRNVHKSAGAILGPLVYLTIQNNLQQKEKVALGELLLSYGIGLSTSRIPDILEPAIHPNHRAFYHSLTFAGITGFVGFKALQDLNVHWFERKALGIQQWSKFEILDVIIVIGAGSILLHLIMDGFTKKGLNII
jgi:hypothetical protein